MTKGEHKKRGRRGMKRGEGMVVEKLGEDGGRNRGGRNKYEGVEESRGRRSEDGRAVKNRDGRSDDERGVKNKYGRGDSEGKVRRSEREKQERRSRIEAVVAGIVLIIVIVVSIIVMNNTGIKDDYFVSDDTKYVLSLTREEMGMSTEGEGAEHVPIKAYFVYEYKDDKVTGAKIYYEYENSAEARRAYNYATDNGQDNGGYEDVKTDGKYLVFVSEEDAYEDIRLEDIRTQVELMEKIRNGEAFESEGTSSASSVVEPTGEVVEVKGNNRNENSGENNGSDGSNGN